MDKYMGIDVHARSCTLAVVDGSGKRVGQHVIETNGESLIECLRMIPGQRHLCMEEGTQHTLRRTMSTAIKLSEVAYPALFAAAA